MEIPGKVRELQRKLYQKAKQEKGFRFYLLYDKVYRRHKAAYKRLWEELGKLEVQINPEKTRMMDLGRDETFNFLGFDFGRAKTRRPRTAPVLDPTDEGKLEIERFRHYASSLLYLPS